MDAEEDSKPVDAELIFWLTRKKLQKLKEKEKIKEDRILREKIEKIEEILGGIQSPLETDESNNMELLIVASHIEDVIDAYLAWTTIWEKQKRFSCMLLEFEHRQAGLLRRKMKEAVGKLTELIATEKKHVGDGNDPEANISALRDDDAKVPPQNLTSKLENEQVPPLENKQLGEGTSKSNFSGKEGTDLDDTAKTELGNGKTVFPSSNSREDIKNVGMVDEDRENKNVGQGYSVSSANEDDTANKLAKLILYEYLSYVYLLEDRPGSSYKTGPLWKAYCNIKGHFDFCAWIHVSDESKTITYVTEQLTGVKQQKEVPLRVQQGGLSRFLSNKKYLLVLYNLQTPEFARSLTHDIPNLDGSRMILGFRGIRTAPNIPNARFLGAISETGLLLPSAPSKDDRPYLDEETCIVGLKDEIEKLYKLICSQDELHFMIIVRGAPGSGKTTLVQAVYYNSHIKQKFEKCAWISVSKVFEERNLLVQMLKQVTEVKDEEKLSLEELRKKLRSLFVRQRYLVVLDDVQIINAWERLKSIFPISFLSGSRVVLTIRDPDKVRNIDPSIYHVHEVRRLNDDESWELFLDVIKEKRLNDPDLTRLKEKILRKCNGRPLAIRMLGGLLSAQELSYDGWLFMIEPNQQKRIEGGSVSKPTTQGERKEEKMGGHKKQGEKEEKMTSELAKRAKVEKKIGEHNEQGKIEEEKAVEEENRVSEKKKQGEIEEEGVTEEKKRVTGIVALGYWDLPSHLRACLSYSCLFPRSDSILIRRWARLCIAEGLVEPLTSDNGEPEDLVEEYLAQLTQRNMIEVKSLRLDGKPKAFSVQGDLYDLLCRYAKRTAYFHISPNSDHEPKSSQNLNIRRLAEQLNIESSAFLDYKVAPLRSYISFNWGRGYKRADAVDILLKNTTIKRGFGLLTLLDLEGVYKPVLLPETLKKMPLLRYVGLRWTFLDEIPKTVGDIPNLETLDVKHTNITALPNSICNAKQLRHLYVNGIDFEASNDKPFPSGSLTNLMTLSGLSIGNGSPTIKWLTELKGLRKLRLTCYKNSFSEISPWLSKRTSLRSLQLRSLNDDGKLSELPPICMGKLWNLKELYLVGELKAGLKRGDLPPNLEVLTLSVSRLREDPMPILEQLEHLRVLKLLANSYTGTNMNCSSGGFPKLQVLKLWMLLNLREWTIEGWAMSQLISLELRCCPNLEKPEELQKINKLVELILTTMKKPFVDEVKRSIDHKIITVNDWEFIPPWDSNEEQRQAGIDQRGSKTESNDNSAK